MFVVYERDVITNRAALTHLISFGTSNLNHNALESWNSSTGGHANGAIARVEGDFRK